MKNLSPTFLTLILCLLLNGCKDEKVIVMPEVSTSPVSEISFTTATSGGNISNTGGSSELTFGVCLNLTPGPTIQNQKTTQTGSGGSFISNIARLRPDTTYYIRSYATNEAGTSYGEELTFRTNPIVDIDGNKYGAATIGPQVWMSENLRTTRLNDGVPIPEVTDKNVWTYTNTPAYRWNNNDSASYSEYGPLYNGFAAISGKLCPQGWHVPTRDEWNTLTDNIGGASDAGGKLKETGTLHWQSPNTGATNTYGFTALPAGLHRSDGVITLPGTSTHFWTSTETGIVSLIMFSMYNTTAELQSGGGVKYHGISVRCIQD